MFRRHLTLAIPLLVLALPALAQDADTVQQLEQRIASLEARIASLEKTVTELNAGPQREREAAAQLTNIRNLVSAGKNDEAKAALAGFRKDYGATQTAQRARSFLTEVDVIGKDAPPALDVEKWYVGDAVDLASGEATLLVFFEEWCPHCKREVPKMNELYASHRDSGLQVVGLTRITRSSTEDKVQAFITTNSLSFPIAKERGDISQHFGVSGIPAAAVVKNGKIVWRGHPARLSEELLQSFL